MCAKHMNINIALIDKYKPTEIKDLLIDDMTIKIIQTAIEKKDTLNIIFVGEPGVGKTTILNCVVSKLLGKYEKKASLIIDVFDDRGIKVDGILNSFCTSKLSFIDETTNEEITDIQKIVVVDEVENMTTGALDVLFKAMEKYENKIRFMFTCNNSEKVINIQEKCSIIRCSEIPHKVMAKRLTEICEMEGIAHTADGINLIVKNAEGDIRIALNNLEMVHTSCDIVNVENVKRKCDVRRSEDIVKLINNCYKKNFEEAYEMYNKLKFNGHSHSDILTSMYDQVKEMEFKECKESKTHGEAYKMKFRSITSQTRIIIDKGINTQLQMSGYFARLCQIV